VRKSVATGPGPPIHDASHHKAGLLEHQRLVTDLGDRAGQKFGAVFTGAGGAEPPTCVLMAAGAAALTRVAQRLGRSRG
jgi:hypothetical protein